MKPKTKRNNSKRGVVTKWENLSNFHFKTFFIQFLKLLKKIRTISKEKKTVFLYNEAYRFFLDEYLMDITNKKVIDFHPALYEAGVVICSKAKAKAEEAMLNVIKNDDINYLYSRRIQEYKKGIVTK